MVCAQWGTVTSKVVHLRLHDEERPAAPVGGSDVRVVLAEQERLQTEHKKKFGGALTDVGAPGAAPPALGESSSSVHVGIGRQFSGML